ncbi:DMT family transporter [Prevotella lacticifex]|uniref:Membrane protein n=1 Tax=Prevotella lacticifex TaxID=2854755 RepID=A0A9R1C7S9_9BACT|nr:DMT family transporter [Prevotella lacticifex]GJG37325.1 membrane protein [Prevotella lacticifex]GJG40175.1 membrane protein [Prevotella lacticifex]GJG43870.1 membrane protein [Prevotella lacticifex]GJG46553.1 membrane protein [Prevotella lacticifex]GJG49696.1 membrane protein [Prevotella lacticifex]
MNENHKKILYHLIAVVVALTWGCTFVNSKILILHGMSPEEIFTVRFIIAYLCIWIFTPRRLFADNLRDEARMALLGITGGSLYFVAENTAIGISYVNNVSFIVCTAPLATTLLAIAIFRDVHATWKIITASILAVIGVGMVIFNGHFVLHLNPLGDALALCACLCWAVYSLLLRGVSKRYGAVFITRKVFFYGLLTMLPFFAVKPWTFPLAKFTDTAVWGNLLFLGLVASYICFLLWSWVTKKIGALKTTNYVYLNPISTVIVSAIFLDEPMKPMSFIGSLLILAGVFVANRQKNYS